MRMCVITGKMRTFASKIKRKVKQSNIMAEAIDIRELNVRILIAVFNSRLTCYLPT